MVHLTKSVRKFLPRKFYEINPQGLYYKTLCIRNLWEIDIFHSKLTSSGLHKPTSLNK